MIKRLMKGLREVRSLLLLLKLLAAAEVEGFGVS